MHACALQAILSCHVFFNATYYTYQDEFESQKPRYIAIWHTSASFQAGSANSCRGPAPEALYSPFVGKSTPAVTARTRHFDGRLAITLPTSLLRL